MEQNGELEINSCLYDQLIFDTSGKSLQWRKDSLFNEWFWETGLIHTKKNETRPPTYTIHKNKLKMDKRLKCKSQNPKNSRRKHWQ